MKDAGEIVRRLARLATKAAQSSSEDCYGEVAKALREAGLVEIINAAQRIPHRRSWTAEKQASGMYERYCLPTCPRCSVDKIVTRLAGEGNGS